MTAQLVATDAVRATSPITTAAPPTNEINNVYIGSLHSGHTRISDGQLQYPEEFYPTFKRIWDWVSTTDHDYLIDAAEWERTIRSSDTNNAGFVSLVGYEWTSSDWGHISVVFKGVPPSKDGGLADSRKQAYDSPHKLYDFLRMGNGLAAFAHPALRGCGVDFSRDMSYRDDDIAPLVGLFGDDDTNHWNATYDYSDGTEVPAVPVGRGNVSGWIKSALDRGYHLGFVGELDMHGREIDAKSYRYTGIVAGALTRDGIFEGLSKRHTYAVRSPSGLGRRILIRAEARKHLMGDAFSSHSNRLEVVLRGTTDLESFSAVNVFVNGQIVESRSLSGQKLSEDFAVDLPRHDNYTFFEVRATAANGDVSQAITSPMYVTVEPPQIAVDLGN